MDDAIPSGTTIGEWQKQQRAAYMRKWRRANPDKQASYDRKAYKAVYNDPKKHTALKSRRAAYMRKYRQTDIEW